MSAVTTHVLDTSRGCPAEGLRVRLDRREGDGWRELGVGRTGSDGRVSALIGSEAPLQPGLYRLSFETAEYFAANKTAAFYPEVVVLFELPHPPEPHYHVPLLLSPFGYTTYRGS